MQSLTELLSARGPIASAIEGFRERPQQQEMAGAIATAIEARATLVCEAGTGTGKTLAYLVAALTSGARTIISTGTKTLQDQLYFRDLPLARAALGVAARTALLKGRANYLCLQRLDTARQEPAALFAADRAALEAIGEWALATRSGDIGELATVPETAEIWPRVTSTVDNCLGGECPFFEDCHVVKARRNAAGADIVVVNHHLFLADMTLREEGFGEIIPSADVVIFDEAHQLPDLLTAFFGATLSNRQLSDLARDTERAQAREAPEVLDLRAGAERLDACAHALAVVFGANERRREWQEFRTDPAVAAALDAVRSALQALDEALAVQAERGQALAACARRATVLAQRLGAFSGIDDQSWVRWVETQRRGFSLHSAPLDVATTFQARVERYHCAWIYTSATLAVGEDFGYFNERLGLSDVQTRRWESPFDFAKQALLYLPELPVAPDAPDYTERVCGIALEVLAASAGRAFVLFTSHRALRTAAGILRPALSFPLLVQGDAPRAELLTRFRTTPNAVLLGTGSFWEGVDVPGEALSCVVIDKLPFATPDDPMLKARAQRLREEGRNPFTELQLPEAVIALKQGVGRLLRAESDRGVLVICDPRLRTKPYGRTFLRGLPPFPITRAIDGVRAFFAPSVRHAQQSA